MESQQIINKNTACDECGRFGAFETGDTFLCADCLSVTGSSCAGSADDGC